VNLKFIFAAAAAVVVALSSCASEDPMTPPDGVVHDACSPLTINTPTDASDLQKEGIAQAIAAWNQLGFTQLTLEGAGEPIAVHFEKAAGMFHGFYDPDTGEVLINTEVQKIDEIKVVVAHELGHAMGLPHVRQTERPSVMNPGNLSLAPTAADSASVQALCPTP
jgi:hypothetical protein